MNRRRFFLLSSNTLLLFLIVFTACIVDNPACLATDVSISCGSTRSSAAQNGREWVGDMDPIFTSSARIKGVSTSSKAIDGSISADPVPYSTARASLSGFSYIFLVSPGQKFIRLHFNPTRYKGFLKFKDLFTVQAGPFTLLSNFSASLTADALGLGSIVKEFCIYTEENQQLNVIFSPENTSQSRNTYAFVNGIEIVQVPFAHSYFHDGGSNSHGAQVVGHKSHFFYIDISIALEMVHRLNVKRDVYDDSGDLLRMWATVPKEEGRKMKIITWKVSVDVGFRYLLRLHLSDLGIKLMSETGSLVFKLLINEVDVDSNMNLVEEGSSNISIQYLYKDYMLIMKGRKEDGKCGLFICLESYDEFVNGQSPFLRLEILRLSNLDNSLASPNPLPLAHKSQPRVLQNLLSVISHRSFIATFLITLIALVNIIVHKLREVWGTVETEEENKPSDRAKRFCRRFSLAEIQIATENFNDAQIIGKGGFGNVYKGIIDDGSETVAIKRLKSGSGQGEHEFLAEIETLSELRHINLLSLIGYCNEHGEMILVYEYMPCGTLADQLYRLARKGDSCASLTWKQRLNICIGAGRGLDYLHTGNAVIHRDVKVTNILLDNNFTAKVSDFGLVKHENINNLQSHVSTKVKGTFGYLDPNYYRTGKLTRKSDTYAFGVVLLEVLCGRPALDHSVAQNEQILTNWAQEKIVRGEVDLIVASNLREEITADSLEAFVDVVKKCLDDDPKQRPTMAEVVLQLVFAFEQQDTIKSPLRKEIKCVDPSVNEKTTMASINEHIPSPPATSPNEQTNRKSDSAYLSYGRKVGKSAMPNKPSGQWDSLWNKLNPFRKNNFSIYENSEANIKLIEFKWGMIKSSTNNFSSWNLVASNGFNDTYMATFPTGMKVAVQVFRSVIRFNDQILLVQNLDHPNILKPLGYSRRKEKRVLVFEFLDNSRLDDFIFGREHLQWKERFKIIMEIARGVAYLHEDSGFRIIHKDISASNILLDENMTPKISGFDSAYKALEEVSYEIVTTSVRGNLGYVCPEYGMHGKCSMKMDVFSFGVLVLEIVSGRKAFDYDQQDHYILIQARDLWFGNEALELVDESIRGSVVEEEVLRCIKVGLLCTQSFSDNRPTMPLVLKLLEGQVSMELQETRTWPLHFAGSSRLSEFEYESSELGVS